MDEISLIKLVSEHKELYDMSDTSYDDICKKNNTWIKIASELGGVTDEDCKKRWKSIRDGFMRKRREMKSRIGSTRKPTAPYKYASELTFLLPYIFDKETRKEQSYQKLDENSDDSQKIDEYLLMKLVSANKEIYDVNNARYDDTTKKTNIWLNIANQLGTDISAEDCKKKWKTIRDGFMRMRRIKRKSGPNGKRITYKYASEMQFLIPYIQEKESNQHIYNESSTQDPLSQHTTSYVDVMDEPPIKIEKLDDESKIESSCSITLDSVKEEETYTNNPNQDSLIENDALKDFFNSMYNTVKDFPPYYQTKMKMDIFKIVSDTELFLQST